MFEWLLSFFAAAALLLLLLLLLLMLLLLLLLLASLSEQLPELLTLLPRLELSSLLQMPSSSCTAQPHA